MKSCNYIDQLQEVLPLLENKNYISTLNLEIIAVVSPVISAAHGSSLCLCLSAHSEAYIDWTVINIL